MSLRDIVALVVVLAAAPGVSALSARAGEVDVKLLDGRVVAGDWVGWRSGEGLRLQTTDAETLVPADDVLAIEFRAFASAVSTTSVQPTPAFDQGTVLIHHQQAGCASVRLREAQPGKLAVSSVSNHELSIPFEHLAAVQFRAPSECPAGEEEFRKALAARRAGEDVIISCDQGEVRSVSGVLETLGPASGAFRHEDRTRTFQTSKVYAVVLASPAAAKPAPAARVTLAEGSAWPGQIVEADGLRLTLRLPFDAPIELDVDRLAAIEFSSDRLTYLAELDPARVREEGRLTPPSPHRKNRNVANGPLRLGGKVYEYGVGVHALSELTYAIDGAYQSFYAVVGIDDGVRPRGNVVFRVTGDGRTIFDSGTVTGKDVPREVRVSIAGVKELTLMVDYADGLDLSDHADWCEARLIKPSKTTR